MKLRIQDTRGERVIELHRRVSTVGSAEECQIQLFAPGVHQVHGVIYQDPTGYRLVPSSADCLILIEGAAVQSRQLQSGDEVVLGEARLQLFDPLPRVKDETRPSVDPSSGASVDPRPEIGGDHPGDGDPHPEIGGDHPGDGDPRLEIGGDHPGDGDPRTTFLAETLLQQLETFSTAILNQEPWPRPAEILLDSLLCITGAEHGFMVLMEDQPSIVAARPAVDRAQHAELLSDSILRQVMQSREPLIISDAQGDPLFASAPSVIRLGLSSVMCLPLQINSALQGALYMGHRSRPDLFGPEARGAAHILSGQAALLLQSARQMESLRRSVADLERRLDSSAQQDLVAESPQMTQVLQTLERAAPSPITLLLRGDRHGQGGRWPGSSTSAPPGPGAPSSPSTAPRIPKELLESELFGHRKGAFTGADQRPAAVCSRRPTGAPSSSTRLARCRPTLQVKLLRVLAGADASAGWATPMTAPWTCVWSRPPTATSRPRCREVPRGPLLPPGRAGGAGPAPARAPTTIGAPGPALFAPLLRRVSPPGPHPEEARPGAAWAIPLAGQHPRAAEPPAPGRADGRCRGHQPRGPGLRGPGFRAAVPRRGAGSIRDGLCATRHHRRGRRQGPGGSGAGHRPAQPLPLPQAGWRGGVMETEPFRRGHPRLGLLARLTLVLGAWMGLHGCPLTIEPSEDSTEMLVGSPCEKQEDCEAGTCLTDQVGGYCTLPCLNEPCPEGSRCVLIDIWGFKDGMCLRSCQTTPDCGRPGYYCGPAHDGGAMICGSAKVTSQ